MVTVVVALQIITMSMGYIVCIGLGILFMVVFPIIGICFCCCRCCGNCGGKRVQNPANNNTCKRMTYAGIFGLLVLFISVGVICLFVTNGRMTVAIDNFETVFDDSITDADSYIQLLKEQIQHLGADNYNFTGDVIIRDLRAMDAIFGAPVAVLLQQSSNITVVKDDVTTLQSTIDSLSSTLGFIDTGSTDVDTNLSALKNSLSTVKGNIQNTFASCNCGGNIDLNSLDSSYDTSTFPSVTSQISAIDNAIQFPVTTTVDSALTVLNDLPCELRTKIQSAIEDVKTTMNNFEDQSLQDLISIMSLLTSTFNVSDYSGAADVYIDYVKQYDAYRVNAGMGLAGLVLVITVLMWLGLFLGIFFSSVDDPPTERSSLSNAGGNMLIASVILIFAFSWLFMLLATLTYALGAPLERWVCQPASDINSPLYTEFLDKPGGPLGEGYFIGNALYGNSSMDITVSGILRDCIEGKAAYSAIRLNNFYDVDEYLDYAGYIDFQGQLSSLQSHLAVSVNIITPQLESSFQSVKDAVNVDTDLFITQLDKPLTDVDLFDFAQSLRSLGDDLVADANADASAQATRTELYNLAGSVDSIRTTELLNLQNSVNSLKTNVTTLHNQKNQVVVDVDNLAAALRSTEDYLNNGATPLLERESGNYVYRLTRTLNSYITYTSNAVKNDLGKCDILYKLFADMFTIGVCKYTLDAFNAIWFSLGWCILFFSTSIVFAVKLSQHFQCMHQQDGRDYESKQSAEESPPDDSGMVQSEDMDYESKQCAEKSPPGDSGVVQSVDVDEEEDNIV
ncbi:prominin-1-like isoform X2 [Liolophura sinensis]|uniref:prominin-1-like isoform X2 n=1 Tax=Liolophura sinensis TaxID=3198878 RepID=UPI003159378F